MNFLCSAMAESSNKRYKRQHSDAESEDDHVHVQDQNPNSFPKFIIVQALNKDKPITSLSPFVIEKQVQSILGTPRSIKNLRNGNLLIEVGSKHQAENLLATSIFFNNKVKVYAHPSMNSSRGVVRCKEISSHSLEDLKVKLAKEGVTDVKRITIRKNEQEIATNTYIFTFNTPILPKKVKISYITRDVEVYIPNPLRCFRCQKFGHHEDGCKAQVIVCGRCAETGHDFRNCKADPKCVNCHLDHQSNSRKCDFWKKEKEILRIKHTDNISFFEARKIYDQRFKIIEQNQSDFSYANVAKPKQMECSSCKSCKTLIEKMCQLFPEKSTEIRQLLQSSEDELVSSSNQETPKASETNQKNKTAIPQKENNQKKPEPKQTPKQVKVNNQPRKKISLPENSISKNKSADSSADKNRKIKRYVVDENNEVALSSIPSSPNKYHILEDMEDEDTPLEHQNSHMTDEEEDGPGCQWKHPPSPSWSDDPSSWVNSKAGDD